MTENAIVKNQAVIEFGAVTPGAMIPRNFEGLYRMASIMAESGLMPKGIDTAPAVFVAVQMGLEVGLSPMQAVQNIAVINNRPCMWGDAVLALVRASGLLEDFDETIDGETATCTAVRKGQTKPIIRKFSMADAKQAELTSKSGPWKQYPKRMLQMRARSWALRDGFGDVLKGLHVAEEVQDYDVELKQTTSGEYAAQKMEESYQVEDVMTIDEQFILAFSGMVETSGVAFSELDKFVETLAAKKKTTVEAVKESAIKEKDRFIGAFTKHLAKMAKEAIEKPVEPEKPKAPILCPSTKKGVFPEECAGCAASEKCDQYTEFVFEQGQVAE